MRLRTSRTVTALAAAPLLVVALALTGCAPSTPVHVDPVAAAGSPNPAPAIAPACTKRAPGPTAPPPESVTVDPAVPGDLSAKTRDNPPGTLFWLAPGTHILGTGAYDQVAVKDGNTYLGAPGAVLDGRNRNQYAFTTTAVNVTIRHLTVRGFVPPQDQGVVNHDSGDGWVIEHNAIEENGGAGLMAGSHQQMRDNCLRRNGQYGLNAYQAGDRLGGLVLERNEITGNNTDDWESRIEGCGCTGGVKFWSVDGADIRSNWVHDNRGTALWADTNNNDFVVEDNVIEGNDGEAVFFETSYNLQMRHNVVRRNALVKGKEFADRKHDFPVGAVYLSESGGEPRVHARIARVEISGNLFEDNWSGVTAWENADRFCNSPANTSSGTCTLVVPHVATCAAPAINTEPLYSDCRWRTQHVLVQDNTFSYNPTAVGCHPGFAARQAVLSNFGTYPDWSPYKGERVQKAISREQDVRWVGNAYSGPWTFTVGAVGTNYSASDWQGAPYLQDQQSSFADGPAGRC